MPPSPSSRRAWIEISISDAHRAVPVSPSSRRAWIEIRWTSFPGRSGRVALLAEGVDRNSAEHRNLLKTGRSPSSRRAWIEIPALGAVDADALVALLAEGVDRNPLRTHPRRCRRSVALLAEGVDRNKFTVPFEDSEKLSPSSRRAWIEIRSV